MQKSTMILSWVLGVISVGSVLMFANPGMQEALVSNIFWSRMYSVPAKPVTPTVINKTPWGVTPSKPSISGEVIVTNKWKYEGFMNGRLFISTASITKEEAYSHCKQNSANNMNSNIRCTWNGVEILAVTPYTPPKPSISGEVILRPTTPTKPVDVLASITITVDGKNQPDIYNTYKLNEKEAISYCANLASKVLTTSKFSCIWNGKELSKWYGTKVVTGTSTGTTTIPKPATPVSTGRLASTGTMTLGTLTINTNFSIDKSARYNIAETEAKAVCESTWKKYENDPKSTQLTCTWNGKTIFSKTKPSSTSTGSTASGVITPAKPVDVVATIVITVDGKVQQIEYANERINEKWAVETCLGLIWNIPTSTKVSCMWNGKELSKGFGTKVVTPINTGSTSTGTLTPTALLTGALVVLENGKIFSGKYTNETKDHALTICKNILSDISAMSKVECTWNKTLIFTGVGNISILEIFINNKPLDQVSWESITYCEKIKIDTSTDQTVLCKFNGTVIYSGKGTKVVTTTNSGSVSSGTVTPLATLTMTSNYWGTQTQANTSESGAVETCNSTWKKYETNSQYTTLTCSWNGKVIFSKTKPSSTSTGSTSTGSVTSTGTMTLGTLIKSTDFSIDKSARYNIAETEAKAVCESTWKKYENDPKSTQLTCAWNGKTIFSKTKP